ncbi:MAG TPA: septum formation initiator family protein [Kiloniellales bacterium]|nr:septum formation initiator family protein [Kiloniellales bacterium]
MPSLATEVRRRLRWVVPQFLALGLVAYFGYHLLQGDRGLRAYLRLEDQIAEARVAASVLQGELETEARRVKALSSASLDPDLLEERAQAVLGFLRAEERVILLPSAPSAN